MKIGIIGNGFVGKATRLFECQEIQCLTFDKEETLCNPAGTTLQDIKACDIVFVCVPTPMDQNGDCYLGIVKQVVQDLKPHPYIVVRSTLPPGTADNLGVYFMPEFLTEKNWSSDFYTTSCWIFGGHSSSQDQEFRKLVTNLINTAFKYQKIESNHISFLSRSEAEAVKYFRNSFLATKVSFCNEFYRYCEDKGIDYSQVAKYACLDTRIGSSHTQVPGHDGHFGFGGTCLPKDTACLRNLMKNSPLLDAVVYRNDTIDRPEKDWQQDHGRAFISGKSRILITGGAGFIGNNLARYLLNQGEHVVVIDNFCSSDKSGIQDLLANPCYTLIDKDVLAIPKLTGLKQIYHLACAASPPKYQTDPLHTIKTCVMGTMNVLELAKENGCPLLFSSTSEIYGEPLVSPQPESYRGNVNTVGPRSCYDEGKRMAETLCYEYGKKLDIKMVRIFNTYGPRMTSTDGRVITNFLSQALKGDDLTVYGSGSQTRSFCYIDDLVRGLVTMMSSTEKGPINLGNPTEQTILEIANKIIKITGSSSRIVYKPLPVDDPTQRCPDITLAKVKLGWSPEVDIETGIRKMIDNLPMSV
jgi:UDP-glucuronate decarboxylase